MDGFGSYEVTEGGSGSNRQNPLAFRITGITGDVVGDYAVAGSGGAQGAWYFAAHVAGFDDMPYARLVWPELTTVRRPLRDMASTAVDLLLEPEEDEARRHVVLDFEIIERGSTGPRHG